MPRCKQLTQPAAAQSTAHQRCCATTKTGCSWSALKSHAACTSAAVMAIIHKARAATSTHLSVSNGLALCSPVDMASMRQPAAATKAIPEPEHWRDTGVEQEGWAQECWLVQPWWWARRWSSQGPLQGEAAAVKSQTA